MTQWQNETIKKLNVDCTKVHSCIKSSFYRCCCLDDVYDYFFRKKKTIFDLTKSEEVASLLGPL